jgi:hypothetical protein
MTIHHAGDGVQYWYDRGTRCWWAARFDAAGNQIGNADHGYSRREIKAIADDMRMETRRNTTTPSEETR